MSVVKRSINRDVKNPDQNHFSIGKWDIGESQILKSIRNFCLNSNALHYEKNSAHVSFMLVFGRISTGSTD